MDEVLFTTCEGVDTVSPCRSLAAVSPMPVRIAASSRTDWLARSSVAALLLELRPAIGLPLASVVCPIYADDVAVYSLGEASVSTAPATAPSTTRPRTIHQLRASVPIQPPTSMAVRSSVVMQPSGSGRDPSYPRRLSSRRGEQ